MGRPELARHIRRARCPLAPQGASRTGVRRLCYGQFCGDALGAAGGDGAAVSVTGFAVAAGETLAAGLVAAVSGAVVAAGEPAAAVGEAVVAAAGAGIPINSLCKALSLELR